MSIQYALEKLYEAASTKDERNVKNLLVVASADIPEDMKSEFDDLTAYVTAHPSKRSEAVTQFAQKLEARHPQ